MNAPKTTAEKLVDVLYDLGGHDDEYDDEDGEEVGDEPRGRYTSGELEEDEDDGEEED